jgi:hypothetical protein
MNGMLLAQACGCRELHDGNPSKTPEVFFILPDLLQIFKLVTADLP